jgi:hypothetical protein
VGVPQWKKCGDEPYRGLAGAGANSFVFKSPKPNTNHYRYLQTRNAQVFEDKDPESAQKQHIPSTDY